MSEQKDTPTVPSKFLAAVLKGRTPEELRAQREDAFRQFMSESQKISRSLEPK